MEQVEDAKAAVAEAERKAKDAARLAADAEAARATAAATAADLERRILAPSTASGWRGPGVSR